MADLSEIKSNIIITPEGHWLWQGATTLQGYGTVGGGYEKEVVSRVALGLKRGDPRLALHKNICHTPNCCNPEHLYIGSDNDNVRDSIRLGTKTSGFGIAKSRKTHCPQGHEYNLTNTYYTPSTGYRKCLACIRSRKGR
jgi:hypothetical protein